MSHGSLLERVICYPPLHRDRPGSGPGEKHASNTKQQLLHRETQVYRKQDVSICTVLVGGTHYAIGGATGEGMSQPITTTPYPCWRVSVQVFMEVPGGAIDSDTGIRMGLWELLWDCLSHSSCLLCKDHLPPNSPTGRGSLGPFQLVTRSKASFVYTT